MTDLRNSFSQATLEVVATLRDRTIAARIAELRQDDELTLALRSSLRNGVDINSLSDASGLTVSEIQRRTERGLHLGEDLDTLSGAR